MQKASIESIPSGLLILSQRYKVMWSWSKDSPYKADWQLGGQIRLWWSHRSCLSWNIPRVHFVYPLYVKLLYAAVFYVGMHNWLPSRVKCVTYIKLWWMPDVFTAGTTAVRGSWYICDKCWKRAFVTSTVLFFRFQVFHRSSLKWNVWSSPLWYRRALHKSCSRLLQLSVKFHCEQKTHCLQI